MPEGIYRISECDRCGLEEKVPYGPAVTEEPIWPTIIIRETGGASEKCSILCPDCLDGVMKALMPLERKRKRS